MATKLRLTEIFYSLQGEAKTVGIPTVFVRLTGCPLRCQYCDTAYAFNGGQLISLEEILAKIAEYPTRYVTVTGGEPLAQPACQVLLTELCDRGYFVSLETSGALDVAGVDPRVVKVLDIKTPGSQESAKNYLDNLNCLSEQDLIKFVICNREDYEWSKQFIDDNNHIKKCEIYFSPSHGELDNQSLADWIIEDRLQVRFQLQMHKYIWGDQPGK